MVAAVNAPSRPVTPKRWFIAFLGALVLMVLGSLYVWSIFVIPLEEEFGWVRAQTSVTFSICMCMLCIGSIVSGLILRRYPHRLVIVLSGLCMGGSYLFTSRIGSLAGLYLCYGALMGLGIGMGYNAVINAVMRWFPEKMGFITGFLMMGFGFGGMALSGAASGLLYSIGWRSTFVYIGVTFLVFILLSSIFIVPPGPRDALPEADGGRAEQSAYNLTAGQMLGLSGFWLYFLWCTLLSAGGLMLIGHAGPIIQGLGASPELAALFIGVVSIFNGLGRLSTGIACDRLGYKRAMAIVSVGILAVGLFLIAGLAAGSVALAAAAFVLAGFSYGGVFPINSFFVGKFYGLRYHALNFGIVNLCMMTGSVGPYIAGFLQTSTGSYFSSAIIIAVFGGAGTALLLLREPSGNGLARLTGSENVP